LVRATSVVKTKPAIDDAFSTTTLDTLAA